MFEGEGEIWHMVDTEFIRGGKSGNSLIQQKWAEGRRLWENSRFVIAVRDDKEPDPRDLPPYHRIIRPLTSSASHSVRMRAFKRQSLKDYVVPEVEEYIEQQNLYRGHGAGHYGAFSIKDPRPLIFADEKNPEALSLEEKITKFFTSSGKPNLIITLGGDGTMLRAIRTYWRKRIPFFGINLGHFGFLLNDVAETFSPELLKQELIIRHSPLLFVETEDKDGNKKESLAFNDVWLQIEPGKTGWFEVRVDGVVRLKKMEGDVILASSAAGSAAYARAMGASPAPIGTEVLIVAGSAVARPLDWKGISVLPLDSIIEFRNCDESGWRGTLGFADGVNLGMVQKMKVRASRIAAADILDYNVKKKLALAQFPSQP